MESSGELQSDANSDEDEARAGTVFKSESQGISAQYSKPNSKTSATSMPCSSSPGTEHDIEPISYDAAMSLPPYPDFAFSPRNHHSTNERQEVGFEPPDLSFFLEVLQGVRSPDDAEEDDSSRNNVKPPP